MHLARTLVNWHLFRAARQKSRQFTQAANAGVGMTPHVKLNVQIPADCTARAFFFLINFS